MSAKRAWDIQRKPAKPARIERAPVIPRAAAPVRRPQQRPTPLKARRKAARRRVIVLVGILVIVLVGSSIYFINRPGLRVSHVDTAGAHAEALSAIALSSITGNYFFLIPRDSIFFIPEESIRQAVLNTYLDVSAVSVSRTGLTSIYVDALARVEAFAWCGDAAASSTSGCYEADAEGYIFEPIAPTTVGSTTELVPVGTLKVYGALTGEASSSPIRATVADASAIPDSVRFVHALETLGAQVDSLQLRGDEADVFLASGTRVTYLLGHEQQAADVAATAFPTLNLKDGSIDYIDLRFDGKAYYKNKGQ